MARFHRANMKSRKVGKKNSKLLQSKLNSEIESERPARVRRNGKEINTDVQVQFNDEKLSIIRKTKKKPISTSGLPRVEYINSPCVYILINDNKIVYVGETTCLARRLGEHLAENIKEFTHYEVHNFISNEYIRKEKEKQLIRQYKPKYNIVHK